MKSNHITILKTLSDAGFSAYIVGDFDCFAIIGFDEADSEMSPHEVGAGK